MKLETLHEVQRIPAGLPATWKFFSDPRNLPLITPPWLGIRLTSHVPGSMHPGMILAYRIRGPGGIPMRWISEITHLDEPRLFADEQRFGPYRFWHHLHRFREVDDGTEVEDLVHYALPFGAIGRLAGTALARRRLAEIFGFRRRALAEIFGRTAEPRRAPQGQG